MKRARLALLGLLLCGKAAAQTSEPWVFVEYDGGSGDKVSYNAAHYYTEYRKAPDDAKELYGWIARSQRAPGEDAECYGKTLKGETVDRAAALLESSLNWYYKNGFTAGDFERRTSGVRVEKTLLGHKEAPGRANYFSCKKAGFFSTSNIGAKSANLITMGPATGTLNRHEAAFRLAVAHELGHVFHNNTAPYARSDDYDKADADVHWLIEGSVDAMAVLNTQGHYGRDYFGPWSNKYTRRFFLSRPYHIPLNMAPPSGRLMDFPGSHRDVLRRIEEKTLKNLAYQTNGFWYHVIERYLGGDAGRLRELYGRMDGTAATFGVTHMVDRFLDTVDGGSMTGLKHVYPQFLSEYAAWWKHRFSGKMDRGKWLELGFGGCEGIEFTPADTYKRIALELAELAGDCLTVRIPSILTTEKPDLEIRLNGDGRVMDEVYLGHASATGLDDARRNADCYEIVTRKLSPKPAPCLLDPRQGKFRGVLQRYFNVPEIRGSGGDDVVLTFVVTRVPNSMRRADFDDTDYALDPIRVTVSLDKARLKTGDEPAAASGAGDDSGSGAGDTSGSDDDAGEDTAVVDYASKSGRARVSPEGEKSPGDAGPRDIFSGNFDTMPIADEGLRQQMMQMRDAAITVRLEPGEHEAGNEMPAVGFQFMDDTPQPGDSGPVEAQAVSSRGERFGVQNPGAPSRLIIEEYSDETLRFRGVAHVCEGTAADLMSGGDRDLCEMLERKTYRVEGSVSFPTARNSVARLQNSETDAYLAYRDLRLDALLGPGNSGGLLDDAGLSSPGSGGGSGDAGGSGQSRVGDDGCDCSCAGRSDDPEIRCKLLCAKEWKACE